MSFFQHALAVVESSSIGDDTRIWAFAHILPGAHLGCECNICDHTFIENDVTIGDRVAVKCGVQLWDGIDVEDDVFIGPNATFTNDPFPRSKQHQDKPPRTRIRKGASIGANATILPGLTIGERSMGRRRRCSDTRRASRCHRNPARGDVFKETQILIRQYF